MSVKNITWNRSMACRDTIGLLTAQPIQVECMSTPCSLYFQPTPYLDQISYELTY